MSDYDSIGKGNRGDLYATLMSETFARDVNVLDATQRKSEDVMLQQTLSRVKADEAMRARLQGPTIKKEKFSSRYWSTWNKEKNLLEDLSYADMLNPPKNKSAAKEYKKNKRRAVHVQLTSVAPKGQKVLIFDIPLPPTRIKKQPFDAHLLGDTSVQSLLRDMHKMNMQRPTRPKEGPSVPKESSFDPEELGVAHVKGGAFPEFDRLPKNAQGQLTAKCDFAPFGDAVQANKGATFGSGVRFPVSVVPVGEGLAPLPEIKRPLPGGQFSKAGRFADKSSQGSVTVMVLVPPTEAEAEAEANAGQDEVWGNGTRGAVGRLSGVREVREEEELGGGDGDGGDGDAVGEFWDTEGGFREAPAGAVAGAGAGVGAGPVQTLPAQPKYTTFEYYPNDQPGPGHYQVGRMFDGKGSTEQHMQMLVQKHSALQPGLMAATPYLTSRIAVFGKDCIRQEHVLYGMCLDGRCCRRTETEMAILRSNDLRRLAGYQKVQQWGRNKDGLQEDMLLGEAMCQLIEEPQYAVEPLYAAAYRGDEHAIQQLARLGADPNIPHMESGYSALHVAVFRYKLSAVTELLRCFRGQLRLDLQDLKGDTALHMAARSGYLDICSAICDEHSCDPLAHPNNRGQFPSEICRSHKIYQVIQVCQKRNELARELEQLRMM